MAPDGVAAHQQLPRDAQLERRHDRPAAVPVLPDEPAGLAGLVHRRLELPLGALPDGSGAGGGAALRAEGRNLGRSVLVRAGDLPVAGGADDGAPAEADYGGRCGVGGERAGQLREPGSAAEHADEAAGSGQLQREPGTGLGLRQFGLEHDA